MCECLGQGIEVLEEEDCKYDNRYRTIGRRENELERRA